jgi:alkaline phosphatase
MKIMEKIVWMILMNVLWMTFLPECQTKSLESSSTLVSKEDKHYWRNYGTEDLKSRLAIKPNEKTAKNIIIFIGDGMGVNTHTAARIYKGQKNGGLGEEAILEWEKFPYTGQSKTYNTDHQVADSAGTATAMFSGVKTKLGVLGIDDNPEWHKCDPELVEKSKVKTLLQKAIDHGKSTGIVTDMRVTHATPGALYANIQDRDWESDSMIQSEFKNCTDIAKQLIKSEYGQKIDLIFGGGLKNFLTKADGGVRNDENLIQAWERQKEENGDGKSFKVLTSKNDLESWDMTDFALGLFTKSAFTYVNERDGSVPSLELMVEKAIKRLKRNPKGFFLMMEAGLIDYGHHDNFAKKAFEETLELEKAVIKALDLTKDEEDETLIVVTGDHSHAFTINGYPKRGNPIEGFVYNEGYSDGRKDKRQLWGEPGKLPWSTISYANGRGFYDHFNNNTTSPWKDIRNMNWKEFEYRSPALIGVVDESHGGEDVPILAKGPWAHLFTGMYAVQQVLDYRD